MDYKRILTIQDISCVGQCSMTVALPILSACGQEICILPSAVLSSHTGGFGKPTFRDLTEDIPAICEHWREAGINFDLIYTGYLGSVREIGYAADIISTMLAPGGKVVVDPAMADHGKLYAGFDETYAKAMKGLCEKADVIIPNITEAAMMADLPYREEYDEAYIRELIDGLKADKIVLTGIGFSQEETGVVVAQKGRMEHYSHAKVGKNYHGTGDIFASALVGAWAGGKSLEQAARIAADYTKICIENTWRNPAHWYGVKFETALPELIRMLNDQ